MHIGIPREIKPREGRVALHPAACRALVENGHTVLVEHDAGRLSGYPDADFEHVGATVVADAAHLYGQAELIVKVKEPDGDELDLLQAHHVLFSFLHLAPMPGLLERLLQTGLTAIGFETVADPQGRLPILAPMSTIAGRIATQVGTHLLHQPQGGRGVLLGGLAGAERGRVVVIGAGHAGSSAAMLAAAMGAEVTVFDLDTARLASMHQLGDNVTALYPDRDTVDAALAEADLLVGAVLQAGKRAPHVVSRKQVSNMPYGSVIVDISVDQGGCIETTRPTTYAAPTYVAEDVVHFCVTNMPGAVPRSATQALAAVLLPYVHRLASANWRDDAALLGGVNVAAGQVIHPALKETLA